jgi:hypothetical protein
LDHPVVTTDFGAWDRVVVTVQVNFRSEFGTQKLSFDRRGTWTLATSPTGSFGGGISMSGEVVVDLLTH